MRRAHMASGALQRETPERLPAIAQLGNKRPDEQATTVVQVNNGESEHAGAPVTQFHEHHAEAMVAQWQQELARLRGREAARMAEEISIWKPHGSKYWLHPMFIVRHCISRFSQWAASPSRASRDGGRA